MGLRKDAEYDRAHLAVLTNGRPVASLHSTLQHAQTLKPFPYLRVFEDTNGFATHTVCVVGHRKENTFRGTSVSFPLMRFVARAREYLVGLIPTFETQIGRIMQGKNIRNGC